MSEPTQTIEGWYAYHDFRTVDWASWKSMSPEMRQQRIESLQAYSRSQREIEGREDGSYGVYLIAGHKADLLIVHFRKTMEELIACKTEFEKLEIADELIPAYSYVSIVELSSYLSKPGSDPKDDPRLKGRLEPKLSTQPKHVCFYPMNKRRNADDNWYMLDKEKRIELMTSHGMIGRSYAGRVYQIITGSIGFDDWEWGVTLYAQDPLEFKKLIYEMRFDEVSARYAEFGPVYVGHTVDEGELAAWLNV